MAVFFATLDGVMDARRGSVRYFWALFTEPWRRRQLIREGWQAVAKVFIFAAVMDLVYQYLVLGWMYPGAALAIGLILVFVPYVLIRGPVNRLSRAARSI